MGVVSNHWKFAFVSNASKIVYFVTLITKISSNVNQLTSFQLEHCRILIIIGVVLLLQNSHFLQSVITFSIHQIKERKRKTSISNEAET